MLFRFSLSHIFVFRLKQEDEAWVEVGTSYNSFRAAVLEELEEFFHLTGDDEGFGDAHGFEWAGY